MEFVDTHCHIQSAGLRRGERLTRDAWAKSPDISGDILVAEAASEGVGHLICVGCDLEDSRLAIEFVKSRENCYASIGIHPHESQNYVDQTDLLDQFEALLTVDKQSATQRVVAIGECGLDYYYEHSPKAAQLKILHYQLQLAQKNSLPVIFHVREAFDDFWPVFDRYPGTRGVLHSFTDTEENALKAIERGLMIGVNGIATFAKVPQQIAVYKSIPLAHLLLETDAPFLTPAPFRGKVCQPKHVVVTAKFLSELRSEPLSVLAESTTQNAFNLFKL